LGRLVSAHGFDLSPTRPLGGFGMTCPRCQHDNRAAANFCEECGTPLRETEGSGEPAASYADVQRSATEALEQQTATAEILSVISSSPTDVNPALAAVVEAAARLCAANDAVIFRVDGDTLRLAAHHGPIGTGRLGESAHPITAKTVAARAVLGHRAVQVDD